MKKSIIILVVVIVIVAVAVIYAKNNVRIIKFVSYDALSQTAVFTINGKRTTLTSDPEQNLSIGAGLSFEPMYNYKKEFEGWQLVNMDNTILSQYYVADLVSNTRPYIVW